MKRCTLAGYRRSGSCEFSLTCDAFVFTEGVIGDTSSNDACSDHIVLTALGDTSCDLACDEGYKSSGIATVTCNGGSLVHDFTCT